MNMMRVPDVQTKAVVTLSEMARMVGLSRTRFWQLKAEGVFPLPCYHVVSRRPVYVEEQQKVCLDVRRRNLGINNRPVLFYARKLAIPITRPTRPGPTRTRNATLTAGQHDEIVEAVATLGVNATGAKVAAALRACYPGGTGGSDEGEVIRTVFLHLRRQDSADNVQR